MSVQTKTFAQSQDHYGGQFVGQGHDLEALFRMVAPTSGASFVGQIGLPPARTRQLRL